MYHVKCIYCNYTPAALEDELTFLLSSKNEYDVIEDEEGNSHILIFHPYLNQAEGLIYRINIHKPRPEFVIWTSDIPAGLAVALQKLGKVMMNRVITNTVRRLYESVDFKYFHTNGLSGRVRWRISNK
jgi:hypothetical protein